MWGRGASRLAGAAALAAAAVALAVAGGAGAAEAETQFTFSGTCGTDELPRDRGGDAGIVGRVSFDPPFGGATFQDIAYSVRGQGTCDGTLNQEAIADLPISLFIDGTGYFSCTARQSTGFTSGWIVASLSDDPPDDIILPLTNFELDSFGTGALFSGEGPGGGRFTGRAQFVTEPQEEDIGMRCLGVGGPGNDTGIEELGFLAFSEISSETPLHGTGRAASDDGVEAAPSPLPAAARASLPDRGLRASRRWTVPVQVSCAASAARCRGQVRIRTAARVRVARRGRASAPTRRRLVLAQRRYSLRPDQARTVRLEVRRDARRLLRRRGAVRARVIVSAADRRAESRRHVHRTTVRAPKRKSR